MILAHSLLRRNVAEDVGLLLIGSSHAHWTRSALLRCNFSDFFRSLLGYRRHGLCIVILRIGRSSKSPFAWKTSRTHCFECFKLYRLHIAGIVWRKALR